MRQFNQVKRSVDPREKSAGLFKFLCSQDLLSRIDHEAFEEKICSKDFAWHVKNVHDLNLKPGQWLLVRDDDNFPSLIMAISETTEKNQYFVCNGAYIYISNEELKDVHVLAAEKSVQLCDELLTTYNQDAFLVGGKLFDMLENNGL